jgi:hypothetical protein
MIDLISANSSDFLSPIEESLKQGSPVVLSIHFSGCGGSSNVWLLQNSKDLDTIRTDDRYMWRVKSRIEVDFHPVILWNSEVSVEIFKKLWEEKVRKTSQIVIFEYSDDYLKGFPPLLYYVGDLYDRTVELEGEKVIIAREPKFEKWAYVPMADGTIVTGSY